VSQQNPSKMVAVQAKKIFIYRQKIHLSDYLFGNHVIQTPADVGFLKSGFCYAQELPPKLNQK